MIYATENLINVNLTKEEMNVVRNGLTGILSMDQAGKLNLSENARKWYRDVLNKFETIYDEKWQ